ncbi:hypothetical protein CFIMG_006330RAa [Ceratocystis fimbriata CBS 114723]|uniref:PNPLA domain-containing protein n=1 Tax=Ceratocystis fimbriata CBS 114723 TaxID=1035309 RepID=A0A2C5WU43_9PEZI|nr:hypothetical protein CFIMG_006330RAa [Ceratocystis fimbriata CBS 114723]
MASSVRRRDTTKGPPLRILSLDGGGVRGYSMLIIIQDLMHRTFVESHGRAPRRHEIPKPADHFDLIVGTGTGGLIALMLGRLRLDLETCKELYASLTRMVFETDKTIAGIPFRSTIFKASKLEEAIRAAVKEHTVSLSEGNDGSEPAPPPSSSDSTMGSTVPSRHASNASVVSFSARGQNVQPQIPYRSAMRHYGNASARLYDSRENRTKTAVTAVYKGASRGNSAAMLRSYDSRGGPAPEFNCKIWEAGRATCAIGIAFKPIQIGQSCFHDDGSGIFNPSAEALDEALVNEWPGRDVGIFVSVGTGKRPRSSIPKHQWYDGFLGEFAEVQRKMAAQIENCERIHERMIREHLPRRGVNIENYYRFNVEVGVGEFGMNEWNRLAEISTGTRRYLSNVTERKMLVNAASKLAGIGRAVQRHRQNLDAAAFNTRPVSKVGNDLLNPNPSPVTPFDEAPPNVMELPAEVPNSWGALDSSPAPSQKSFESGADSGANFRISSRRSSADRTYPPAYSPSSPHSLAVPQSPVSSPHFSACHMDDPDRLVPLPLTPQNYRTKNGSDMIAIVSPDEQPMKKPGSGHNNQGPSPGHIPAYNYTHTYTINSDYGNEGPIPLSTIISQPPPRPPKTPVPGYQSPPGFRPQSALLGSRPHYTILPYPDDSDDTNPPMVHLDRKPQYQR